jgi:hypothetical protein
LSETAQSAGAGGGADPYRFLLILRFVLFNLVGFALLGAVHIQGYVEQVLSADPTGLCVIIFLVFLMGLAFCAWRIVQVSIELNRARDPNPPALSLVASYLQDIGGVSGNGRQLIASSLRLKLSNRIGAVRHIANSLVFLGLIGTVIGFIIALSGVNPERTSDVAAVVPMVATLIDGMSVALFTTLVGAVLNLWLMINYHMLTTGTVNLITALVRLGEVHAARS